MRIVDFGQYIKPAKAVEQRWLCTIYYNKINENAAKLK